MRALKLITAVALVMAVSGTAWGETIPSIPNGPVSMQSRNQDSGSLYTWTPAAFAALADGATVTFDPRVALPAGVVKIQAPGAMDADGVAGGPLEDTWGIAVMYDISPGSLSGLGNPGSTVTSLAGAYYSNDNSNSTWLTAAFFGGIDTSVTLTKRGSLIEADIRGTGLQFELWAVDKTALDASADVNALVNYGAARTALNAYTGWVGPSVGGTQLAYGTNEFYASKFGFDPATGHVLPTIPGTLGQSSFNVTYWQLDETMTTLPWNVQFGTNGIRNDFQDPAGVDCDVYFTWGLQDSPQGWTAKSQDFGGTDGIPEPLTMVGLFLGVGGVGRYIRRRMKFV